MILDKLMEKKELVIYLKFRREHLVLERQKVPFVEKDKLKIGLRMRQLTGRIKELDSLRKIMARNGLKEAGIFEYREAKYLKEQKAEHLRKDEVDSIFDDLQKLVEYHKRDNEKRRAV